MSSGEGRFVPGSGARRAVPGYEITVLGADVSGCGFDKPGEPGPCSSQVESN